MSVFCWTSPLLSLVSVHCVDEFFYKAAHNKKVSVVGLLNKQEAVLNFIVDSSVSLTLIFFKI